MNTLTSSALHDDALERLRTIRRVQAWGLLAFAIASMGVGLALIELPPDSGQAQFLLAFGWQCLIWGAIDSVFAFLGVGQSVRADRRPNSPQASADEFLSAEKLLRSLRFNHKLNLGYVAVGVLLLAWGLTATNAGLTGHGIGVLVQGGFLLIFDAAFAGRIGRLMNEPTR